MQVSAHSLHAAVRAERENFAFLAKIRGIRTNPLHPAWIQDSSGAGRLGQSAISVIATRFFARSGNFAESPAAISGSGR